MLLDLLPGTIRLAVLNAWLGTDKAASALDIAFCSHARRSQCLALLRACSITRYSDLAPAAAHHFISYLQWISSRQMGRQALTVSFSNTRELQQLFEAPQSLLAAMPSVQQVTFVPTAKAPSRKGVHQLLSICPSLQSVTVVGNADRRIDEEKLLSALVMFAGKLSLTAIDISQCHVDDIAVFMLIEVFKNSLEQLHLTGPGISDRTTQSLIECQRLHLLEINCKAITIPALAALLKACSKLRVLRIHNLQCDVWSAKQVMSLAAGHQLHVLELIDDGGDRSITGHGCRFIRHVTVPSAERRAVVPAAWYSELELTSPLDERHLPFYYQLLESCPASHLTKLSFAAGFQISGHTLLRIADKFKDSLRELVISLAPGVDYETIHQAASILCNRLTKLHVRLPRTGVDELAVNPLFRCPLLTHVIIDSGCITDWTLVSIAQSCTHLWSISLVALPNCLSAGFASILSQCPALKTLELNACWAVAFTSLQAIIKNHLNVNNVIIVLSFPSAEDGYQFRAIYGKADIPHLHPLIDPHICC